MNIRPIEESASFAEKKGGFYSGTSVVSLGFTIRMFGMGLLIVMCMFSTWYVIPEHVVVIAHGRQVPNYAIMQKIIDQLFTSCNSMSAQ